MEKNWQLWPILRRESQLWAEKERESQLWAKGREEVASWAFFFFLVGNLGLFCEHIWPLLWVKKRKGVGIFGLFCGHSWPFLILILILIF
jgi:hypothetical protein